MRLLKPGLLFSISITTFIAAFAQDKIYFATNANQGDVQDITSDIVKFIPGQKNSKSIYLDTKKVLLLFNDHGNFLVPARMDFTREQSLRLIENFLHANAPKNITDEIYIRDKKIIEANVVLEDKDFIHYSSNEIKGKIEKNKVVAVIYKDGRHLIYSSTPEAAEILWDIQQNALFTANTIENQPTLPEAKPDSIKPLTIEDIAPNISQKEFKDKATHKTTLFSAYLKILCNKQALDAELDKATEQAITLFVSEAAEVETASVTRDITRRKKIRKYLDDVRMLRYDKIELEWTRVQYASDIRLDANGNYTAIVSFEQVFRGYRDGKIVYEDITRKDAQVILKTYEKNIDGNATLSWDVLLSDIGVTSYE